MTPALRRELSLLHACGIGLAAMIGAGVFVVFAPAAAVAGEWLFAGIALALVVAVCNAIATAQLSMQYPSSGGSYHFGREQLGEWPGFVAGWGFVIGKTASAAAMALTVGTYIATSVVGGDSIWQRVIAVLAIVVVVACNLAGITRTATASLFIVAIVLVGLAAVLGSIWVDGGADALVPAATQVAEAGPLGALQAGGLIFFAFAGYARIATLGDEVREPTRTIPRAIAITLPIVAVLYVVIAITLVDTLGVAELAKSPAPLSAATAGIPWAQALVPVIAATAALGALLAGIAGITRTGYAMASNRDLPHALAAISPRSQVPALLTCIIGVIDIVLVCFGDIRDVIGFSSVGVLVYYFVANAAAWSQSDAHRRFPRWLQLLGATLCLVLVVTLPPLSVWSGIAVLAVGVGFRLIVRATSRPNASTLAK
ncbi:APC family permease [Gulosibacter bifidus]|uniref:APC family permease n=1 Tax=Gulosibacter bifidus TaxID=272239 RepID=A0ABW5RH71_9MICO|nr:APC family permease [Gulosibacter bifidus]